jgi:hypothetical protein
MIGPNYVPKCLRLTNITNGHCLPMGPRGRVVVEALCYKPEGRGFETR